MTGNAWHWCEDWYDENYYSSSTLIDPLGPFEGAWRVVRGGMGAENETLTSACRTALPSDEDYNNQGFRIVISKY